MALVDELLAGLLARGQRTQGLGANHVAAGSCWGCLEAKIVATTRISSRR